MTPIKSPCTLPLIRFIHPQLTYTSLTQLKCNIKWYKCVCVYCNEVRSLSCWDIAQPESEVLCFVCICGWGTHHGCWSLYSWGCLQVTALTLTRIRTQTLTQTRTLTLTLNYHPRGCHEDSRTLTLTLTITITLAPYTWEYLQVTALTLILTRHPRGCLQVVYRLSTGCLQVRTRAWTIWIRMRVGY